MQPRVLFLSAQPRLALHDVAAHCLALVHVCPCARRARRPARCGVSLQAALRLPPLPALWSTEALLLPCACSSQVGTALILEKDPRPGLAGHLIDFLRFTTGGCMFKCVRKPEI